MTARTTAANGTPSTEPTHTPTARSAVAAGRGRRLILMVTACLQARASRNGGTGQSASVGIVQIADFGWFEEVFRTLDFHLFVG